MAKYANILTNSSCRRSKEEEFMHKGKPKCMCLTTLSLGYYKPPEIKLISIFFFFLNFAAYRSTFDHDLLWGYQLSSAQPIKYKKIQILPSFSDDISLPIEYFRAKGRVYGCAPCQLASTIFLG